MSDKNKPDYVRKSIRMHNSMVKQIEKVSGGNFNRWVLGLISKELAYDGGKNLAIDVDNQIKGEKLDKSIDDNLLKIMNERGAQIINGLSDTEIAKMMVARAPKAANLDYDHETSKLNLYEALKRLPDVEDLRGELIKVKGQLSRITTEYNLQVVSMNALRSTSEESLFDAIRDLCNEISKKSYEMRDEDELRQIVSDGLRVFQTRKEMANASRQEERRLSSE